MEIIVLVVGAVLLGLTAVIIAIATDDDMDDR